MNIANFRPAALLIAAASVFSGPVLAQTAVYDSTITPLPSNQPSQCFECDNLREFGDMITLAPGARKLSSAVVTLSSWACETGGANSCTTTPGSTFTHDITLTLYATNPGDSTVPGAVIATNTQLFTIPFRPSADPTCPDKGYGAGTAWRDPSGQCLNGKAVNITFDLSSLGVTLPDTFIWGVAYNTQNAGYHPLHVAGPYDSLNVGLSPVAAVGTDVDPTGTFINTTLAAYYCDGGTGGAGTFRSDSGCWEGYVPAIRINVANVPTDKNDCKNGGWMTLTHADGSPFKNQGDCISSTKGK